MFESTKLTCLFSSKIRSIENLFETLNITLFPPCRKVNCQKIFVSSVVATSSQLILHLYQFTRINSYSYATSKIIIQNRIVSIPSSLQNQLFHAESLQIHKSTIQSYNLKQRISSSNVTTSRYICPYLSISPTLKHEVLGGMGEKRSFRIESRQSVEWWPH